MTRAPRNHARRVEDLQDLERRGLIRFLESLPPGTAGTSAWAYVVHVAGEAEALVLPGRKIDPWLAAWRSALTAHATRTTPSPCPGGAGHVPEQSTSTEEPRSDPADRTAHRAT